MAPHSSAHAYIFKLIHVNLGWGLFYGTERNGLAEIYLKRKNYHTLYGKILSNQRHHTYGVTLSYVFRLHYGETLSNHLRHLYGRILSHFVT